MGKNRKALLIIGGITLSILLTFPSLQCFSQDVTTRAPEGIGMTENYDFYVFWLNNEGRLSYAISLAYATGDENKIRISPYITHTPNRFLFRAVGIHQVAHYYNFFAHREIKIDTLRYNFPIDTNYWETPPDLKKIVYKGGDGSSVQKAIIIKKATTLREGIGAEYAYIEKELGQRGVDWKPIEQYLHPVYRKMYDIIKVNIIGTNEIKFFCFEITGFFGKFEI
jgi:hypothetical protein